MINGSTIFYVDFSHENLSFVHYNLLCLITGLLMCYGQPFNTVLTDNHH